MTDPVAVSKESAILVSTVLHFVLLHEVFMKIEGLFDVHEDFMKVDFTKKILVKWHFMKVMKVLH